MPHRVYSLNKNAHWIGHRSAHLAELEHQCSIKRAFECAQATKFSWIMLSPRPRLSIILGGFPCETAWVCQKKFSYIKIFSIRPSEVQKPETGQKTGPRTNQKFLQMNWYVNTNLTALKFFQYDHQLYKNRKPDRKPDPRPAGKFYRHTHMSKSISQYWNFSNMTIRSTKTGYRTENRIPVLKSCKN